MANESYHQDPKVCGDYLCNKLAFRTTQEVNRVRVFSSSRKSVLQMLKNPASMEDVESAIKA